MGKQMVIAMKLHSGSLSIGGASEERLFFPDGCIGMCLVFESKKKAREFWGKDVPLAPIKFGEENGD